MGRACRSTTSCAAAPGTDWRLYSGNEVLHVEGCVTGEREVDEEERERSQQCDEVSAREPRGEEDRGPQPQLAAPSAQQYAATRERELPHSLSKRAAADTCCCVALFYCELCLDESVQALPWFLSCILYPVCRVRRSRRELSSSNPSRGVWLQYCWPSYRRFNEDPRIRSWARHGSPSPANGCTSTKRGSSLDVCDAQRWWDIGRRAPRTSWWSVAQNHLACIAGNEGAAGAPWVWVQLQGQCKANSSKGRVAARDEDFHQGFA